MVGSHYGKALRGNGLKERGGERGVGAGKDLDEGDAVVGVGGRLVVEAEDVERHGGEICRG